MKHSTLLLVVAALAGSGTLHAQVPQIINYQGRVVVGATNFNGTGQFRFALVNATGSITYWSNDGTSIGGSQPTNPVSLTVSKGLYSVLLGDTSVANMTVSIPASVFNNSDVRLRVWFNDGTTGSQLLSPDQRIVSVGYAAMAANIIDGAITSAKIVNGAVGSAQINSTTVQRRVTGTAPSGSFITGINQDGTVTAVAGGSGTITGVTASTGLTGGGTSGNVSLSIAAGGVNTTQLALNAVNTSQLADSAVTAAKIGTGQVVKSLNSLKDNVTLAAGTNITITPSGNTLTLAAAAAGAGPWSLNGTNVYYNGGNVGIGTTTPQSALHISGNPDALRLTGSQPFMTLDDSSAGLYSRIQASGAGMNLKTQGAVTGSNPSGLLHLDGVGYVGIGTTTPRHKLSIAGSPAWTSAGWGGAVELENAAAIAWQANAAGQRFGIGHTGGGLYLFRTASDPGATTAGTLYDFVVNDSGSIGMGTTTPQRNLHIYNASNSVSERIETGGSTNSWARVEFVNGNGQWDVGTSRGFNSDQFYISRSGGSGINFAVQTNGDAYVQGTMSCGVVTIRGGADLAEPFQMEDETTEKGSVVVIDEAHPGRLKRSCKAYDSRVAGIVSGANGVNPGISLHQDGAMEGGQNVALSGRVYVKADASREAIQPGDLLTTSDVPGCAMKASDYGRAPGAVLGKAMSSLAHGEKGNVLVLVTLQ